MCICICLIINLTAGGDHPAAVGGDHPTPVGETIPQILYTYRIIFPHTRKKE
jgi:hypothetical protein